MALEDDIEVPSPFNSFFNFDDDNCDDDNYNDDDDDNDDETSLVRKLMSKCNSLLARKNHYKHKLTSLTKEFENVKNELSSLTISNAKLVHDMKNSNFVEEQLKKVNDENLKLTNEMLELKNIISKFQKGKVTLDNLLDSQKSYGDTQGIGYGIRTSSSSSSHINFVKSSSHSIPSSSKQNEPQNFKVKRAQVSNAKAKSNKTQPPLTKRGKVHARNAQPKHAYMYTRHSHHKHVKHPIAPKISGHCHCNYLSHSITQKSYRKHPLSQNRMHVSNHRKAYHPRTNKFANVKCFYCMTKGHTSNVCYYRKLHFNLLPMDYLETNQPRPRKI